MIVSAVLVQVNLIIPNPINHRHKYRRYICIKELKHFQEFNGKKPFYPLLAKRLRILWSYCQEVYVGRILNPTNCKSMPTSRQSEQRNTALFSFIFCSSLHSVHISIFSFYVHYFLCIRFLSFGFLGNG